MEQMDIKLDIDNPAQDEQTQPKVGDNKADDNELTELVDLSLFRLTYGLPRRELRLIVQEATECEAFLLDDIRMLELALQSDPIDGEGDNIGDSTTLSFVLDSLLTPLDRYWTASALLGRLRSDLCLPSLLTAKRGDTNHSKPQARHMHMTSIQDEKAFIELQTSMNALAKSFYRDTIPAATLLTVWKKISSNRAAAVFKKPVRTEDAPGYAERILFPMELSLIRKRIVTNQIQTFSDLHAALGLISYNCVKYNGRETDYGRVARDFEAMADSSILQAVVQASANRNVTAKEFSPTANGSNLSPSLDSTPIDANVECTDVLSIKKTCSVSPNPEDSIK